MRESVFLNSERWRYLDALSSVPTTAGYNAFIADCTQ